MTKYEKLVKDFRKKGFFVRETTCIETVGYDKPTDEYLFTVQLKKSKKKVNMLHCASVSRYISLKYQILYLQWIRILCF